jgi:hypothetical protein
VRLLGRVAAGAGFPPASVPRLVQLLCLVSLDRSVRGAAPAAAPLRADIAAAVAALLAGLPAGLLPRLLPQTALPLFRSVAHPVLRAALLAALPTRPPAAHRLRRRLALAWTLDSERWLRDLGGGPAAFDCRPGGAEKLKVGQALTARVAHRLETSDAWRIRHGLGPLGDGGDDGSARETDYLSLTALARILDIAIDDGFILPAETAAKPPAPKKGVLPSKKEEDPYSLHVAALADLMRSTAAKIVTNGASHISRLDAKSTLERIEQRLRHALQRQDSRSKDWYVRNDGDEDGMRKFVMSAVKKAEATE